MAFNTWDSDTRTFEQLASQVNVPEEALKRVLHSLACGKFKVTKDT